ncbi:MAG: hypothetical protein FWD67_03700 [Betaproteobacteria bacterium]|nr:hypothetical protein [Betaproteobacteria bacterium]
MPSINTSSSGHAGPINTMRIFLPYSTAEAGYLATLRRAMDVINSRIKGHAPCNAAFQALPGGRSFADVWNDSSIWISYSSDATPGYYSTRNGQDITISKYAFTMGHWTVVASLLHELAHVNGAPGNDTQAEDTLKKCLLNNLHDPNVIGRILGPMNNQRIC